MTPLSTAPQVVPHRHALYAWVPPWGPPLATCALPKGQRRVHVLPSPQVIPTHVPHTTYTLGISCRTSREYPVYDAY